MEKITHNMDEFYKTYLPKYAQKYPITMRVSEEEAEFLKFRRGGYKHVSPTP